MGVIPFPARHRHREAAEKLIEALGARAGLVAGIAARVPGMPPAERAVLLAVAAEVELAQGFGWYFGDESLL
jgi:hypothetical protein